jgi:hypothetical protein
LAAQVVAGEDLWQAVVFELRRRLHHGRHKSRRCPTRVPGANPAAPSRGAQPISARDAQAEECGAAVCGVALPS